MTYVKFNPENEHKETCEFEEWKKEEGKMGFCGEPAYGKRGIGKAAKNLCEEHFKYGLSIERQIPVKEPKK